MKVRLLPVALVASAALVLASTAGSRTSVPMTVNITPCKMVTTTYKCVGPFALGIPASSPTVAFYVSAYGSGWTKGGTFSVEVLDSTKQPLTNPFTVKLNKPYPTGFSWWFGLNGPFPKITIYLQPKWNGKPLGPPKIARFI